MSITNSLEFTREQMANRIVGSATLGVALSFVPPIKAIFVDTYSIFFWFNYGLVKFGQYVPLILNILLGYNITAVIFDC